MPPKFASLAEMMKKNAPAPAPGTDAAPESAPAFLGVTCVTTAQQPETPGSLLERRQGSSGSGGGAMGPRSPSGIETHCADPDCIAVIEKTTKAKVVLKEKMIGKQKMLVVEKRISDRNRSKKELEHVQSRCNHPNLIKYFSGKEHRDHSVSVIMEYMDCGSLRTLMDTWEKRARTVRNAAAAAAAPPPAAGGPPLCGTASAQVPSDAQRVAICRSVGVQILSALLYYHIVQRRWHRDVKPGNILVRSDGRVKLSDFDASKGADATGGVTIDGTQLYMSPEMVASDTPKLDGKNDVWSVGVVLMELALGKHPFEHLAIATLVTNIKTAVTDLPWSSLDRLDPDLKALIRCCLTVDPTSRISCADALRHPFFTRAQAVPGASGGVVTALEPVRRDERAEKALADRGIVVNEEDPEKELHTWRDARHAKPSAEATKEETDKWRGQTDEVMKRVIFLRQQAQVTRLQDLLKLLGHEPQYRSS